MQSRLKSPKGQAIIQKAIKHEQRLKFHTETYLEPVEISQPLTVFLDWVRGLIPKDKYNIFVSLFRFPTPVVELTSKIYNELERIFDGRNSAVNFQFNDSTLRDDWEWYRQNELKEPEIWRHKGWQKLKTAINSIVVVDLPAEQTGQRPEPYFYWLGIENVIDFELLEEKISWIVFKQNLDVPNLPAFPVIDQLPNQVLNKKVAAFDDQFLRTFEINAKNEIIDGTLVETKHDLGYCPAQFFWNTQLNSITPELKKSPISTQLSNLDWLLFFSISKRHLDLYAPYPIYSAYATDCSFANNETGDYCDGGFLRDIKQNYKIMRDGQVERCPVCAEKRIAGVGSFIEVPIPGGDANSPNLSDPVKITTVDKESLQYNVDEVQRLKDQIMQSVCGVGGANLTQSKSVNELQVTMQYDDKTNILNGLKGNFEKSMKFVDDTICKLRYGDQFLSSSISLGTEFYIYSIEDLYTQFSQAKTNGASEAQLDTITEQIIATENKNNPVQLQRMLILKQLEPYRHYTRLELSTLELDNFLDPELMIIKINFTTFVDRFERENTNIIEFGSQLPFNKKIDIILNEFKKYGSQQTTGTGANPGTNHVSQIESAKA